MAARLIPLPSINTRCPFVWQTIKSGDHAASVVLNAAIHEGSQNPATTSLVFLFFCQMLIVKSSRDYNKSAKSDRANHGTASLTSLSFLVSSLVNRDAVVLIHLLWWVYRKIMGMDSHVVQHTPATVGISSTEALSTRTVLFTGLHRDLDHLEQKNDQRRESLPCQQQLRTSGTF